MTNEFIRDLLLEHQLQHGAMIVRDKSKYHILTWKDYDYRENRGSVPWIDIYKKGIPSQSLEDFNRSWWLVRSKEQTLGKEENHMSKPDVIIGLVAMPQKATQIVKVIADPKAKVVVVKFTDGATEVVHCSKEDEFDVYVGAAIAEARHKYGTTSKFHKAVDEVLTIVKPKAKKVKMGPIAPGQESVKKPVAKKTAKNSPAKKK